MKIDMVMRIYLTIRLISNIEESNTRSALRKCDNIKKRESKKSNDQKRVTYNFMQWKPIYFKSIYISSKYGNVFMQSIILY